MGATSGFGCVNFTSTHVSYGNVAGPTVGVPIARIIREPPLYGGHKVRPASSPSPPHAPPDPRARLSSMKAKKIFRRSGTADPRVRWRGALPPTINPVPRRAADSCPFSFPISTPSPLTHSPAPSRLLTPPFHPTHHAPLPLPKIGPRKGFRLQRQLRPMGQLRGLGTPVALGGLPRQPPHRHRRPAVRRVPQQVLPGRPVSEDPCRPL